MTEETARLDAVRDRDCPKCGRKKGYPCKTKHGGYYNPRYFVHYERMGRLKKSRKAITAISVLVLAASIGVAHAQRALPPGYPPELYIDQWGQAHWVWHDWNDVLHVGRPMPPSLPRSACYDEHWRFNGGNNPECEGPTTK